MKANAFLKQVNSLLFFLFLSGFSSGESLLTPGETVGSSQVVNKTIITWKDTVRLHFLHDPSLYKEGWDTLAQTKFWLRVINMTSDSFLINIPSSRKPLGLVSRMVWMSQSEPEKICYKDSLSQVHCIDTTENLFVTGGKKEFYEIKKVLPDISKAITVFLNEGCDPWYAQTILLIESPGKSKTKSHAGAFGPFQLMRSVAKRYHLRVTKSHDDRSDLQKSAQAAAKLLQNSLIPAIRNMLDARQIPYRETDLWFRLLVLHAYNAGAGNVQCVINTLNPSIGGLSLFRQIWKTSCGTFKNESQNYSQIAIASITNFESMLQGERDSVFLIRGNKFMKTFSRKNMKPWEAYSFLNQALALYEEDFIDDLMPYDYFMKKVNLIRKEFLRLIKTITFEEKEIVLRKYPASEAHLNQLSFELSKRKRFDDALRLLKLNLDQPFSAASRDSIPQPEKTPEAATTTEPAGSPSNNLMHR